MTMAETVASFLNEHQVDYELVPHPKTYSSHDTALAAHIDDEHIAKAVIVKDNKDYAMVVLPGGDWLKLHKLQQETGREFALAEEDEMDHLFTDCQPGAIPAVGMAYGVETLLDERLTTLANVYFEAGDHENLVHVTADAFQQLFTGVRHGHFSRDN